MAMDFSMYEQLNPLNRATKRAQLNEALLNAQSKQQEMDAQQALPEVLGHSLGENGEVDIPSFITRGLANRKTAPYMLPFLKNALETNKVQSDVMKNKLDLTLKDYEVQGQLFGSLAAKSELNYGDFVRAGGEYYGKMAGILGADAARDNVINLLSSLKNMNPSQLKMAAKQLNIQALGAKDRMEAVNGQISWQDTVNPQGEPIRQPYAVSAATDEVRPIGPGIPASPATNERASRATMIAKTLTDEGMDQTQATHIGELIASGRVAAANDPYGHIVGIYDMATGKYSPIRAPGLGEAPPTGVEGMGALPTPGGGSPGAVPGVGGGAPGAIPGVGGGNAPDAGGAAPGGAPGGAPEDASNPASAFGVSGAVTTIANRIGDYLFGALAGPETAQAETDLNTLMTETKNAIRNVNIGRPTKNMEDDLAKLTVNPENLVGKEGPQRAKNKLIALKGMIDARIADVYTLDAMRGGLDPKTVSDARARLPELGRLSKQYQMIIDRFDTGSASEGKSMEDIAKEAGIGAQ